MQKKYHSMNRKLLIWAGVFLVALFSIGVYLAIHSFEKQLVLTNQQILKPYMSETDVILENIRQYVAYREVPESILNQMESSSATELERLTAAKALQQYYTDDLNTYSQMDAVFVLRKDRFHFIRNTNREYEKQCLAAARVEQNIRSRSGDGMLFQKGYCIFTIEGDTYFMLALEEGNTVWGCWIRADSFLEELKKEKIRGLEKLAFVSREERESFLEQYAGNNRALLLVEQPSNDGNCSLVALMRRSEVFSSFYRLRNTVYLLFGMSLLLLGVWYFLVNSRIIRPVRGLTARINRIRKKDFSVVPVPEHLDREVCTAYETVNDMAAEIEQLKIDIYEEKLTKQKLQMQVLQMQIKPHFFLNGLTTIIGFSQSGKPDMVQAMARCLSRHFRYMLSGSDQVPLEEELEYIRNYFEIQEMKKRTGFSFTIDAEEELLDVEIPILSLQTLSENVLKHSGRPDVKIAIRAETESGEMVLSVDDNGIGFPETERMREESGGIGLKNVRQRLQLRYHGRARLVLYNRSEGGAHAEIRIPLDNGFAPTETECRFTEKSSLT